LRNQRETVVVFSGERVEARGGSIGVTVERCRRTRRVARVKTR